MLFCPNLLHHLYPHLVDHHREDEQDAEHDELLVARHPQEVHAVGDERDKKGAQHDIADPARYVEQIEDESWTEHLRRFDRVTAHDVALRERKLAFHTADAPPVVARFLVERY